MEKDRRVLVDLGKHPLSFVAILYRMKNTVRSFVKSFIAIAFLAIPLFAQNAPAAETPVPANDSSVTAAVSANPATADLQAEIALRDSVMAAQGNACNMEKDSLRKVVEVEQAKCANWEQSYNSMKKDNEVCAQALMVSIDMNEKKKEKDEDVRKEAAMMASSSFLGGLALGALIMWLIMD